MYDLLTLIIDKTSEYNVNPKLFCISLFNRLTTDSTIVLLIFVSPSVAERVIAGQKKDEIDFPKFSIANGKQDAIRNIRHWITEAKMNIDNENPQDVSTYIFIDIAHKHSDYQTLELDANMLYINEKNILFESDSPLVKSPSRPNAEHRIRFTKSRILTSFVVVLLVFILVGVFYFWIRGEREFENFANEQPVIGEHDLYDIFDLNSVVFDSVSIGWGPLRFFQMNSIRILWL